MVFMEVIKREIHLPMTQIQEEAMATIQPTITRLANHHHRLVQK